MPLWYNENSWCFLGYYNELTFTLSNESASGKYYFEPRLGWSEDKLFSKKGVVTEDKEVTISPIELTSGGNSTLYTQIRIYNESKTMMLWESPIYSHTRSNEIMPSNLELKKKTGEVCSM